MIVKSSPDRPRGGVYVDGFNLYHALDDLKKPYLKWLSLRRLAERLARGHAATIERIAFCTAYFPGDFGKRKRHETYVAALQSEHVEVLMGHTTREPMSCHSCGRRWDQPREKETDINVALSLFDDCAKGIVDTAFLVTPDTDQAATLRFVRNRFPAVRLVVVTPPGREKSKHLRDLSAANIALTEQAINESVFPATLTAANGRLILRPDVYTPPAGWVHPDQRP